jgi:hypothetical protein
MLHVLYLYVWFQVTSNVYFALYKVCVWHCVMAYHKYLQKQHTP